MPQILETARQKVAELKSGLASNVDVMKWIEFREADARQMPFDDASFDVVFASLSLHHAGSRADRTRVLTEMKRVMKPGGVILVYDMFPVVSEAARTFRQLGITEIQHLSGLLLRVLRTQTTA